MTKPTDKTRPGPLKALAAACLLLPVAAIGPAPAQQAPPPPPKATDQDWADALRITREIALDTARTPEMRKAAMMAHVRLHLTRGGSDQALKACREVFDNPKEQVVAEAALRAACFVMRQTHGHVGAQQKLLADWARSARGAASQQGLRVVRADLARTSAYLMGLAARNPTPPEIHPVMPAWGRVVPGRGPAALTVPKPPIARPPWLAFPPGQGLRPLQRIALPVATPPRWLATDKNGVPKPLQIKLPVYTPPAYTAPDKRTGICRALQVTFPVYAPPSWYARVRFPLLKEAKK